MSYSIVQQGDTVQSYVMECICDTEDDINSLPVDWVPGSTCIVIATSSVYMLGCDGAWHEL